MNTGIASPPPKTSGARNDKGFTFIETILCVIIVGLIASVAARVLVVGLDTYSLIVNRNDAFQTARLAMDRMVDELVMLDRFDITWMGNTKISFIDTEGRATNFQKVTYTKNKRTIPCINRGDDFLAGDVTFLDFDYLKIDGSNAIFNFDVRRINIDMTVTAMGSSGSIHLRTNVFPRNLMYDNFE